MQDASDTPTLSSEDALSGVVDEFPSLDGKTPDECVLVATADSLLVYQFHFGSQTEEEIDAGLPSIVAVDANSGDVVYVDRLAGTAPPAPQHAADGVKGQEKGTIPPLRMSYTEYYTKRWTEGPGQALDLYVASPSDVFWMITGDMQPGEAAVFFLACFGLLGLGLYRLNKWLVHSRRAPAPQTIAQE